MSTRSVPRACRIFTSARSPYLRLWLLSVLLTAGIEPASAQHGSGTSSYIDYNLPKLRRPASIDGVGIPLGEALDKLSASGVRMTCSRDSRDLKLQIRLRDKPLGTIMGCLAEFLPGEWRSVDQTTFRLEMDPAWLAKRKKWWNLYNSARAGALDELRAALRKQLSKPIDSRTETNDTRVLQDLIDANNFFSNLSEELRNRIVQRIDESSFYRPTLSFSGDDAEITTAVLLSRLGDAARSSVLRKLGQVLRIPEDAIPIDSTILDFRNGGMSLMVSAIVPDRGTTFLFKASPTWPFEAMALPLDHRHLPQFQQRLGSKAPAIWKPFVQFQSETVWNNRAPAMPVKIIRPPRRRVEELNRLVTLTGTDFIADYYSQPGTHMPEGESKAPLVGDLAENLNRWSYIHDSSWKDSGKGIYLMRNNRWYRDDLLEVPETQLRRWLALKNTTERSGGDRTSNSLRRELPLQIEFVANLSRYQIASGLQWIADERLAGLKGDIEPGDAVPSKYGIFQFFEIATQLQRQYYTVRFCSLLNASQREALLNQRLPVRSLTGSQAETALSLVPEVGSLPADRALLGLTFRDRLRLAVTSL